MKREKIASRFEGRRVLVTGAASGIGLATAKMLADEGARLALLDRNEAALQTLGSELNAFNVRVDLSVEDDIRAAVAASAAALGGLDIVLNIAGITGGQKPLAKKTLAEWNLVLSVNLTAPMLVCREAFPYLVKSDAASIVNVASGQGLLPNVPGMSDYAASKGGLILWSKAIAQDFAPNIRVNVVCPGTVDTPLLPDSVRANANSNATPYALRRIAAAEEIAEAILFLAGPQASFITGVALSVDGGRSYH